MPSGNKDRDLKREVEKQTPDANKKDKENKPAPAVKK